MLKHADWFTLCATVGRDDNFAKDVGSTGKYEVPKDGELPVFANDLKAKMGNNIVTINVTIKRTA